MVINYATIHVEKKAGLWFAERVMTSYPFGELERSDGDTIPIWADDWRHSPAALLDKYSDSSFIADITGYLIPDSYAYSYRVIAHNNEGIEVSVYVTDEYKWRFRFGVERVLSRYLSDEPLGDFNLARDFIKHAMGVEAPIHITVVDSDMVVRELVGTPQGDGYQWEGPNHLVEIMNDLFSPVVMDEDIKNSIDNAEDLVEANPRLLLINEALRVSTARLTIRGE